MAETPKLELLESEDQVQAYLDSVAEPTFPDTFRTPKSIVKISQGHGNGVFRLIFDPNTSVSSFPNSLILKHSTPYILNINDQKVTWDLWPFELLALRDVPNTEFVKTPKMHWVDEANRVMFTEDAGLKSKTLKDLLLSDNIPDVQVFRKIGEELGKYLVKLHEWGRDPKILEKYENKVSRSIAAWRTYGRLEEALKKVHPDLSEDIGQKIQSYCEKEKEKAIIGKDMVIMGDFWTGNVLVNLTDAGELESLYIIDWEMIRPADAATEISQMLAEVWEAGEFGRDSSAKAAAKTLTEGLCLTYKGGVGNLSKEMLKEVMLSSGAHIIVWAEIGFASYGDAEKFKIAKQKAAQFIFEALGESTQSQDWGFGALSE